MGLIALLVGAQFHGSTTVSKESALQKQDIPRLCQAYFRVSREFVLVSVCYTQHYQTFFAVVKDQLEVFLIVLSAQLQFHLNLGSHGIH